MRSRTLLLAVCGVTFAAVAWFGAAEGRRPDAPPFWQDVHTTGPLKVYRGDASPAPYLLAVNGKAVLIDAPDALTPAPAKVELVLLTHHHRDSVAGVGGWLAAKVPVRASKTSAEWLTRDNVAKFWKESIPLRNSRTAYFVAAEGFDGIDCSLADNQVIDFAGYRITPVATPGHSRDHLAFAVSKPGEANPLVFCGDAVTGDGRLWTPFTTDWDHWTDAGLKPAAESLRKLAKLKPAALFPARGPVVKEAPAALLERAAGLVEEAGFLKSFERYTDRLGNVPRYDFLVPKEQVASAGEKPWARVSEHLWITGNTYVLVPAQNKGCLVVDPWGQRSVDQVQKLRKGEQLGPVEVVVFSHAHYDHYDGVYTLPGRDGYKVWALDLVAGPLKDPLRLRAPFLDARPIKFDKTFADGEAAAWREYALRFHALPGQTAFTSGIEATIDGKRCYFTADNFFHMNHYSGSGGWMGLNRSSPAVYARSAEKVLAAAPDWVLAEHGGPYVFNTEDYRRRVRWGDAAGAAADAVSPSGSHRRDWDPHRLTVEPVLQAARPGGTVKAVVKVTNLTGREGTAGVVLLGSGLVPDQALRVTAAAGQTGETPVELRLPESLPAGRRVFAVRFAGADVADAFLAVDVAP